MTVIAGDLKTRLCECTRESLNSFRSDASGTRCPGALAVILILLVDDGDAAAGFQDGLHAASDGAVSPTL